MIFKKRSYKRLTYFLFIGFAVWMLVSFFSARYLTQANPVEFDDISSLEGYTVENLSIKSSDDIQISSWYIRNSDSTTIILLSGIRGNRTEQLKRAKFYLKLGVSVLLPDLRGTGKSGGDKISFGWHERKDLQACIGKLKEMGVHKIAADGQSLGAATIVYSFLETDQLDFIILESCYDNITQAFKNRVQKYHLPYFFFKPTVFFTEQIIGEAQSSLTPDKLIPNIKCPTLILAGDQEDQIPTSETRKLYQNCGAENKQLHLFKGGKHEDLYNKFPIEYERVVTNFIESNRF